MELLEGIKEFGVLGGGIGFFALVIRLNVAELIFNNEFDRIFWSKSKRSISQLVSLAISFGGIFLIIFILGTVSVLLSNWMVIVLAMILIVVVFLYFYLVITFIINKENRFSKLLKKYFDVLSTTILVISSLVMGNHVFNNIGGVNDINSFQVTNAIFISSLGLTYLLLVFVQVHALLYRKYVKRYFLLKSGKKYIPITKLQNGFIVIRDLSTDEDHFINENEIINYTMKMLPSDSR